MLNVLQRIKMQMAVTMAMAMLLLMMMTTLMMMAMLKKPDAEDDVKDVAVFGAFHYGIKQSLCMCVDGGWVGSEGVTQSQSQSQQFNLIYGLYS